MLNIKKYLKKLLKIGSFIGVISPFFTIVSCTKTTDSSLQIKTLVKNQKNSIQNRKNVLWKLKIPKNFQEITLEDQTLLNKYPQYKENKVLEYSAGNPNANNVWIYLIGGPLFFQRQENGEKKFTNLVQKYFSNNNVKWTEMIHSKSFASEDTNIGVFDRSENKTQNKFSILYDMTFNKTKNTSLASINKKFSEDVKIYNFWEAQTFLMNNIWSTRYSLEYIIDVHKLSIIMLHKKIQQLQNEGKKVFVHGMSFGATTLYGYITKYGDNTNGMLMDSGPLNKSRQILPLILKNKYSQNKLQTTTKINSNFINKNKLFDAIYDNYVYNLISLQDVANALVDVNIISQKKLSKKTIIALGTKDKQIFESSDKSFYYKLQNWQWQELPKSGLKLMKIQDGKHGLTIIKKQKNEEYKWDIIFTSNIIMFYLVNNKQVPNFQTEVDLQNAIALQNWYLFSNQDKDIIFRKMIFFGL